MNYKKVIIIVLVVIIILAGFLVYRDFWSERANKSGETSRRNTPILPFGSADTQTNQSDSDSKTETSSDLLQWRKNRLFLVSLGPNGAIPSTGAIAISPNPTSTIVRYMERGTGHIFEVSNTSTERRITNTTIPKVQESRWQAGGNSLFLRYTKTGLDTITTYFATIQKTASTTKIATLDGNFLEENIKSLSLGPTGQIFTLREESGRGIGTISDPNGKNKKQIFNSPISEWNSVWPRKNTISLTSKSAADVDGFLYFLNPTTGITTKILGNIPGLATLSDPFGLYTVYTESSRGSLRSYVLNEKTGKSTSLPFTTLPEKCAWSSLSNSVLYCGVPHYFPGGLYPDNWYDGSVALSDDLWVVDVATGETLLLVDTQNSKNLTFDTTKLFLDPDEHYLFFTNKNDMIVWALDLQ